MTNKTDHWYDVVFPNGTVFKGTEGAVVPSGTTGQRPVGPAAGTIRFNTSLGIIEGYDGSIWQGMTVSGGSLTTFDVLTDTPPSKASSPNRVLKVDNTGTVIEYSAHLLILPSGAIQVDVGYDTLVTTDEILTNKKYVDDSISAIGTPPFLSLTSGGTLSASADITMGTGGQILADAGTAGAPSYSFSASSNTGIHSPIANSLSIDTGGSTRINVTNATTFFTNDVDLTNKDILNGGNIDANTYTASGTGAQFVLPSYVVAGLPTGVTGGMIFVTDESGGPVPAYYDGSDWRRVTDGAVVS